MSQPGQIAMLSHTIVEEDAWHVDAWHRRMPGRLTDRYAALPEPMRDVIHEIAARVDEAHCIACDDRIGWVFNDDGPLGGMHFYWFVVVMDGHQRAWPLCEDCTVPFDAEALWMNQKRAEHR